MKDFLKELLEYNRHFNEKICATILENQDRISDRSLQLFNHIINAQQVWNYRIVDSPNPVGIWEMHPIDELQRLDKENFNASLEILDNFELDTMINYTNTKGERHMNSVRDILFHIINHGTYHRAQINSDMKINKIEPLVMDYIMYKR